MKRKLIPIIFPLLFLVSGFTQEFAISGTEWYYSEHAGGLAELNSEYVHLKSTIDTLIEGQVTHKIERTHYEYDGDTITLSPTYVYESSDTVFFYDFETEDFKTLYIFNGSQHDTLVLDKPFDSPDWVSPTYRLVIDTVETIIIDGIPIKKFKTTALDDFSFHNGGYFMQDIGGQDWFTPRATIFPEEGGPIRCFLSPQFDTSFQVIPCDFISGFSLVPEIESEVVVLSPNPTDGYIRISASVAIDQIMIYALTGKLMGIYEQEELIDLSSFSTGHYVAKVFLASGNSVEKKIIKR